MILKDPVGDCGSLLVNVCVPPVTTNPVLVVVNLYLLIPLNGTSKLLDIAGDGIII